MNAPRISVQYIPVEAVKPYERNNKTHTANQITLIAESISKYGFLVPIVIDEDFNLIAGHGRHLAAKKIGLEEVPSIMAKGLSVEQVKEYRLIDNRLSDPEFSPYNMENLKVELVELQNEKLSGMFKSMKLELTPLEMPNASKLVGMKKDKTIGVRFNFESKKSLEAFMTEVQPIIDKHSASVSFSGGEM